MSTIYAFTTPARGHLYPLVPILNELRKRGHRVKVWTLASELERVTDLGIEAEAISPEIEALPLNDWQAKNEAEAIRRTFGRFLERAPHEIDDLEHAVAGERPDLILTDINAWGASAAAEASGIQWASFSPFFTWLPDPRVPGFGPGMAPGTNPLTRLRDAAVRKVIPRMLDRGFLEPLNELRAGVGVGPLETLSQIWTRPPKLLYMTVRELEYERESWPESFRFIGPINWQPDTDAPQWLADVNRPLILLTASTEYQADEELIRTGLEALADEDVFVVATSAGNDPAQFDSPANARIERFVPHGPVLARAEAVICHGGMGITQKALAAGVPVCTVGWGRDQLESGRRLEVAGAGALLPRKKLSAGRLRETLDLVRGRRAGAARIAAAIERAPGANGAADELEALLSVSTPVMS
jgi:MGT family glycosyltransferase